MASRTQRLLKSAGPAGLVLVICGTALFVVTVARTAMFVPQYTVGVDTDLPQSFDTTRAITRLSELLTFETIGDRTSIDTTAFLGAASYLEDAYPSVFSRAQMERVGGLSLLLTIQGSNADLNPLLVTGHLDVVPVEDHDNWRHLPFAGAVDERAIWGRGAIDNKGGVIAALEALELLMSSDAPPQRTVYLALGHDEETGGRHGAAAIASLLAERGVELDTVIDEGGIVASNVLAGLDETVALIGTTERGHFNISLSVKSEGGGHSAIETQETSIEILASGIDRLSTLRRSGRLTPTVDQFLDQVGPLMPLPDRYFLANTWLFKPLVVNRLASAAETSGMVTTTISTTMINAGVAANVLPGEARAIVNVRALPGDSPEVILPAIRKAIGDTRIEVELAGNAPLTPSVSPVDDATYRNLASVAAGLGGSDSLVVTPFLFVAGTDSKHYSSISAKVYRFSGMHLDGDDLPTIHGVNEHLSIDGLVSSIKFYYHFIRIEAAFVK